MFSAEAPLRNHLSNLASAPWSSACSNPEVTTFGDVRRRGHPGVRPHLRAVTIPGGTGSAVNPIATF